MPKADLESLTNQLGYLSLNETGDCGSEPVGNIKNTMLLQDFVENLNDIQEFWIQKGTTGKFFQFLNKISNYIKNDNFT